MNAYEKHIGAWRSDVCSPDIVGLARRVGDATAGLGDQQHASRQVPRIQVALPIGVVAARRPPGEAEGRRAEPADARQHRKRARWGKRVSVRVYLGVRRSTKKKRKS